MALTEQEYQKIMHTGFPLSHTMGALVKEFSADQVVIEVPLSGNSNPHNTAFGGSLNTAMILAGWSRTYFYMQEIASEVDIVIARSEVKFIAPVAENIRAIALAPSAAELDLFWQGWRENKKGRLNLTTYVERSDGKRAAEFLGKFVVLPQH